MKKSVFSRPFSKETHNRNAFDRSFICNYNFSAGMMLPTFAKFCFGHSHVRINQQSFFRTSDVNRPAFPSLPVYTDYFFVPMRQLLTGWNAFRSQTNEAPSSLIPVPKTLPFISDTVLRDYLKNDAPSSEGELGYTKVHGAFRLLDLLDYGYTSANIDNLPYTGNISPFMLAAYQKIYYDHYRNSSYERNYVTAYNLDSFVNSDGIGLEIPKGGVLSQLLDLHYVNYRRDSFNTVYPSLYFVSEGSLTDSTYPSMPSSVVGLLNLVGKHNENFVMPSTSINVSTPTSTASVPSNFSLQNLRAAFAYEKLLRVSAFAPQHVRDQFKARFGYSPKSENYNASVRLKSFVSNIVLGEVTNQSPNSLAPLGYIGAKGVGASDYGKPISYDVPEDGIIMGISYCLPAVTYDSNKIDMIHQQFTPEDWSLPEYENLGLQPLFKKNVYLPTPLPSETATVYRSRQNSILGYQPRDMQYKASVSSNHGLFAENEVLSPFVLHGRLSYLKANAHQGVNGVSESYFKCDPADLNYLFVEAFDESEDTDQFYGNVKVSFACIQDKPIFGIENF